MDRQEDPDGGGSTGGGGGGSDSGGDRGGGRPWRWWRTNSTENNGIERVGRWV